MYEDVQCRVRGRIAAVGKSQAEIAAAIGLTPSKLSKSIHGTRQFSAVELARLSAELGVSMHWLVTGEADPSDYRMAARHAFDSGVRNYTAEHLEDDLQVLENVALVYRQGFDS